MDAEIPTWQRSKNGMRVQVGSRVRLYGFERVYTPRRPTGTVTACDRARSRYPEYPWHITWDDDVRANGERLEGPQDGHGPSCLEVLFSSICADCDEPIYEIDYLCGKCRA